jgi:hypothetical protein
MMDLPELGRLDDEVARAAQAWEVWRAERARAAQAARGDVAGGDANEHAFDLDALRSEDARTNPLRGALRRVASRATYAALGAPETPAPVQSASAAARDPVRSALRSWVAELTIRRLAAPYDAWVTRCLVAPQRLAARAPDARGPAIATFRDVRLGLLTAAYPAEIETWHERLALTAPLVADAARRRAEARREVARRLGLEGPSDAALPGTRAALRASAERLLALTADVAVEVLRPRGTVRQAPRPAEAVERFLRTALAREAGEGWPARLTARWLRDAVGAALPPAARGAAPAAPTGTPIGASSFARGLASVGVWTARAAVPAGLPFVLGHEVQPVREHTAAWLFAALVAHAPFHARALGLGRDRAREQARCGAAAALLAARVEATRLLLGDEASPPATEAYEQRARALFGAPVPSALASVWPFATDDAPARWLGLLAACKLHADIVAALDEDWFRNPRSGAWLRTRLAPAPGEGLVGDVDALARGLSRALEGALD